MTAAIGVVLAGGQGRRMGSAKAVVEVAGRPLLAYPLAALREVCARVVVVAKDDSVLPPLPDDVDTWIEPDEPQHPLTGLLHALHCADGADVLACAVDLVALDAATLQLILDAAVRAPLADVVVPRSRGGLQPLCALYRPSAIHLVEGHEPDARVRDVVAQMTIAEVPFADDGPFTNINTPADVDQSGCA